jgi:thiamine-monophosphate kinase
MARRPPWAELGEFGLIGRVVDRLAAPPPPAGPGDDAAVLDAPDGRVVASTDLLAEGVHFRLDWSSPLDVGHRAAAANLADIAAMGAVPTALLVGVALPPDTTLEVIDGLADGLRDECSLVGAAVVGGDTIRSVAGLLLAVTALGDLQGRAPLTRAGARPGDELLLAGRTGWAAAGLALLQHRLDGFSELVGAHRRPRPPYAAGPQLATAGAHAAIDVSDGLLADAGQEVVAAAGHGALLDWELTGGDDHALLVAVPAGVRVPAARLIGRVQAGSGVFVDGHPAAPTAGHDHFRPGPG